MKKALVSIHDVMPSTLSDVAKLIDVCRSRSVEKTTLLVVPGCDWSQADLGQLHRWVEAGHSLAGHGWSHRCRSINGMRHRVHSLVLSRDVAEHLSLTGHEIEQLICDCADWFAAHRFDVPWLYVPPAWALGTISDRQLGATPFQMFETLSGVRIPRSNWRRALPLLGFEADTLLRQVSLRCLNRLSLAWAGASGRALRVGIHPRDHRLLLRRDLNRVLAMGLEPVTYESLATATDDSTTSETRE